MSKVTLYRPTTLENALNDFNRYVESLFDDSPLSVGESRILNHLPLLDVRETDTSYVIEAELPGYDDTTIEVHVNGGALTLASKSNEAEKNEKKEGTYILQERRHARFSRTLKLPENADSENITAAFKNGILILEIKKRTETQKRVIKINKAE
ncbi:MAG: Hsp20/alpha crystallin family protein [Treponema sp.]|jgi:HSP20 family protein|nr:Hsp20/alpha crystallin family protein [Treponema sp.]